MRDSKQCFVIPCDMRRFIENQALEHGCSMSEVLRSIIWMRMVAEKQRALFDIQDVA